jgi:hypothetical protein
VDAMRRFKRRLVETLEASGMDELARAIVINGQTMRLNL